MSVHFKPPSDTAPVADFREFYQWKETNRYRELTKNQNDKPETPRATGVN